MARLVTSETDEILLLLSEMLDTISLFLVGVSNISSHSFISAGKNLDGADVELDRPKCWTSGSSNRDARLRSRLVGSYLLFKMWSIFVFVSDAP